MTGPSATAEPPTGGGPELFLDGRPRRRRAWLAEVRSYWPVLRILAAKEFKTRYRGTAFGVVWAVAVPLLQTAVLAAVFSRIVRFEVEGGSYAAYVMTGMLFWSYFAATLPSATTSIVDGSNLADKVWFPRVLLVLTAPLANLIGLVVTHVVVLAALPLLDVTLSPRVLLLPAASVLLVAFTVSLGALLGALQVYFRDVRFVLQAAMLVWIYMTPIIYPADRLGRFEGLLDFNPLTGVVAISRYATLGSHGSPRAVVVAVIATLVLAVTAIEVHRRHDRRFVDLL